MAHSTLNLPELLNYSDEIERNDKKVEVHRLKSLLRYLYATKLEIEFSNQLRKECYGCEIGHPSQLQHSCLDPEVSWEPERLVFMYVNAENVLNKAYLKAHFLETAGILKLNSRLLDIDEELSNIKEVWETAGFTEMDQETVAVPLAYHVAAQRAMQKLDTLEARFTRLSLTT